jgi:hypothetical protein
MTPNTHTMKKINNALIRSFRPCYDPLEKGIPDGETLSVKEWVEKYRDVVPTKDILWLLLREPFFSKKDLRLFAVWCAREALKLIDTPDERSINAVLVAERFANGEATVAVAELEAAYSAAELAADSATNLVARLAAYSAAYSAADSATRSAAEFAADSAAYSAAYSEADSAARSAAYSAADSAARSGQLEKLSTYLK